MVEEEDMRKKKNKKKEEKQNNDFEDFEDDVEADKDIQKQIKIYKNKDRLKHMTEEELNQELQELELIELVDDLTINEVEKEEVQVSKEEEEQIDDLISKMEKVDIDKD